MATERPPGWYPDPYGVFEVRWWDGHSWAGTPSTSSSVGVAQVSAGVPLEHETAIGGPSVRHGFEDTRAAGRISLVLAVVAAGSLVAAATLSGWTYLSPPVNLQFGQYVPLWLLMFPPFGWAVYLQRRELLTTEELSSRVRTVLFAVGAAFAANALVWAVVETMSHPDGQPGRDPKTHQYQVDNHGSITVVSKTVYESLVLNNSRLILGWPALFVAIALPVIVNEAVRVRRIHAAPPPEPHHPTKSRRSG